MQTFVFKALLITAATISGCKGYIDGDSRIFSDSNVKGNEYSSIIDEMDNLASAAELITSSSLGSTIDNLAIQYLEIKGTESVGQKPLVVITDAIHGNEYQDMGRRLAAHFAKKTDLPFFQKGGTMIVIPVMNPDGYEHHRNLNGQKEQGPDGGNSWGRMNKNKKDLNRDFSVPSANITGFTQPETQAFQKLMLEKKTAGLELKISFDYHCCLGPGTLLYPYVHSNPSTLNSEQKAKLDVFGNIFKQNLPGIKAGPNLLPYPARGVSMDYILDQFQSAAYVYEAPDSGSVSKFEAHTRAWEAVLDNIATTMPDVTPNTTSPDTAPPNTETITKSSDVYIKIFDASGDSLQLAASYSSGESAKICKGNLTCAGESSPMPKVRTLDNGRALFKMTSANFTIEPDTEYTVVVSEGVNQAGKVIKFSSQ